MSENNKISISGDTIELNGIMVLSIASMPGYVRDVFIKTLQGCIDAYDEHDASDKGYDAGRRDGYRDAKHEAISLLKDM